MASGYGLNGGPSRCFPFWQEVMACYVTNTSAEDTRGSAKCIIPLEDYLECLHHHKEEHRTKLLQSAYRKKIRENPQENAPTAKEIRSLGLLDVPIEQKHLKTFKWLRPNDPEPKEPVAGS